MLGKKKQYEQQSSSIFITSPPDLAVEAKTRSVVGQTVENNDTDDHDKQPDGYYYEQYEAEPS